MGLDFSPALLPGERPSWCTSNQQPVSPPAAFSLPSPTIVYLPAPDGKRRIKRTAVWFWEEPEWKVVVRREGSPAPRMERVERPLPPLQFSQALPYGAVLHDGGVQFVVYSHSATAMRVSSMPVT